ncbi:DUF4249 domain-containing protein [uncultured Winogradskyella sp.]|uniref:DUF4249 domain-containing protein n=1 Tax=uncultured Winogradskyella sp. TaxID=395353 RepID=UPI00263732B5|nr:DUF4249 domain-containing protein [uncultured Winogradskyella sp.]
MKSYLKYILLFTLIGIYSCEDVIDVQVPTTASRLVIEASLDWQKGTSGNNQTIKLSLSSPYFDVNTDTSVTGASVKVTNNNSGEEFVFTDLNNGLYTINNFDPIINNSYTLEVVYNDEVYTASETLLPVPEITHVEQSLEGGIDDELLDVSVFWNDPVDENNYYFVKFFEQGDLFVTLDVESDEFTNGNEMDEFFEKDGEEGDHPSLHEFESGDVVEISLYGVSEQYFNYLKLLLDQYYSNGDAFSTSPVEIRGNCINLSDANNYAFGYFRLAEYDSVEFTFD